MAPARGIGRGPNPNPNPWLKLAVVEAICMLDRSVLMVLIRSSSSSNNARNQDEAHEPSEEDAGNPASLPEKAVLCLVSENACPVQSKWQRLR
ncbi:hypothetical protein QVD17_08765 [Tagetes erecta]|uniref:Uncharacterized protein n=1 Tax=Tagetes erecta TaxID=13708 RepID=A0AAD8KZD6_TARER|nr:hypothetical protein QVD17_08765 [Tagetes erecta]